MIQYLVRAAPQIPALRPLVFLPRFRTILKKVYVSRGTTMLNQYRTVVWLCLIGMLAGALHLTAQDAPLAAGDEVLVIAAWVPVLTAPGAQESIAAELIKGMKSQITAESTDSDGSRWLYLTNNAYGWIPESLDNFPTLIRYSDAALAQLIAEATARIEADPDDMEAYVMRGGGYLSQREYDAAITDFTLAIALASEAEQAWLYEYRGKVNLDARRSHAAIADFTQAINLGNTLANTYNRLGIAHEQLQDHVQARVFYNQAQAANPAYGLVYNNLANAESRLGNPAGAIMLYGQAIETDPYYGGALANRGIAYKRQSNYEAALEDFNAAIEVNPYCSFCYRQRGILYGDIYRDHTTALADHNHAVELDPYDSHAYSSRGVSRTFLGLTELAIEDFKQAIALDVSNQNAHYNLATLYSHLGRYSSAMDAYTEALAQGGQFSTAPLLYRAQVYHALGDYDAAAEDVMNYIWAVSNPRSDSDRYFLASGHIVSGIVHLSKEDYHFAMTNFSSAFAVHAIFAQNYNTFGAGYRVTPLRAQLIPEFQVQIAENPQDASLHLELANLYMEFGRWQEALESYEQYLSKVANPPEGLQLLVDGMRYLLAQP